MTCSSCGTQIDPGERFCRNCGWEAVPLAKTMIAPPPTVYNPQKNITEHQQAAPETAQLWSPPEATPYAPPPAARRRGRSPYTIPLVIISILVVAALGLLTYYLLNRSGEDTAASNTLPDHFGLFLQSKGSLIELRLRDSTDGLSARDALLNEQLPQADAQAAFILFAESQDIPITDLKLIQLDSIKENGQVTYWSYQAAPVEGRSNMKRIKVPGGLGGGKYAFVLFNGYLNEGNHKFWPFQLAEGGGGPGDSPMVLTLPVKPKPNASPSPGAKSQPTPRPTTDEKIAYCNMDIVNVRRSPDLNGAVITVINRGQKLRVLRTSSNYSTAYIPSLKRDVTDNWTEVQLYNNPSVQGWVFSYFISYR